MFDTALFLGILVDEELEQALSRSNPHLRALFIQEGSDYLHEITHQGSKYLGKQLGKLQDVSALPLVEQNIYSLFARLLPDYPWADRELVLCSQQLPNVKS